MGTTSGIVDLRISPSIVEYTRFVNGDLVCTICSAILLGKVQASFARRYEKALAEHMELHYPCETCGEQLNPTAGYHVIDTPSGRQYFCAASLKEN